MTETRESKISSTGPSHIGLHDVFKVSQRRLGRLLRRFRERCNWSIDKVETNLVAQLHSQNLLQPSERKLIERGARSFEEAREAEVSVALLQVLASAYGIPRLLLDYLLSPVKDFCVAGHFESFLRIDRLAAEGDGIGTTYSIPPAVLNDTDEVAIVYLQLEPGGQSIAHNHPGSELLYVLDGEVELRLESSGLWTILKEGNYAHYFSEQIHWAYCRGSKPATILIIRYLQLALSGGTSTRLEYLRDISGASKPAKADTARQPALVVARVVDEMSRGVTPFAADVSEDGKEIVDRFGLARLLRLIASDNDFSLQQLADRSSQLRLGFSRSAIDRLQKGLSPLSAERLPMLATLYDVQPFLFCDFLYPTIRNAVVVRPLRPATEGGSTTDLRCVPRDFLGESRVSLDVPCRRLTDSDMAIVFVTLPPKTAGPTNRHPGHELLVHLRGKIQVEFPGNRFPVAVDAGGYAHYHSDNEHRVVNTGDEDAYFLVIRFQG